MVQSKGSSCADGELFDALSENVREEGKETLTDFSDKIEIRDLTYGYEPENPVLNDLSVPVWGRAPANQHRQSASS